MAQETLIRVVGLPFLDVRMASIAAYNRLNW